MKTLIWIVATTSVLAVCGESQELPPTPPPSPKPVWSMVYLPSLDWTEAESRMAIELVRQVKPGLVVSVKACPFAEELRALESKPEVIDEAQRLKAGKACGIAPDPLSAYRDNSTFHPFGGAGSGIPSLVWLSAHPAKNTWNGPRADEEELRVLARAQIRKHFAERRGEVLFLADPSVPTPSENQWSVPIRDARFEQTASGVTGFACIRPDTLQTELPAVAGISPRLPLIHWISSGDNGIIWEVLPIDGGPAVQRAVSSYDQPRSGGSVRAIASVEAPVAISGVPLWMDDYINGNQTLGCGENVRPNQSGRRFGWAEGKPDRDDFKVLPIPVDFAGQPNSDPPELLRGEIRSPGNLFSVKVGQLDEKGIYPEESDDGINVYLQYRHGKNSRLLYFAGLYSAWPSAATWFTDRYVITTGTCDAYVDPPEDSAPGPRFHPMTIHLFDLVTGKTHSASGMPSAAGHPAPTEMISFPADSYAQNAKWKTLWKAVETGYSSKPEQAPISADVAAASAKLQVAPGLTWKDLGIWPPPDTWELVPEVEDAVHVDPEGKSIPSGDPYLTCKQTTDRQLHYTIAILGYNDHTGFEEAPPMNDMVARASLFTSGKGASRQVQSVQRVGDDKRFLLMAGNYQKPGTMDANSGKWMLLIDLLQYRSWSAHW